MTEQSTRLSRRWLYIPFAVAGFILLAYFFLWRVGAHEMKKAVGEWVEDQRAEGLTVSHGAVRSDGFPFFLRVHIDAPTIAAPGAWRWRGERLTLDALPYDLNRLIFSPTGDQSLSAEGYGEWLFTADALRASVANDKAREWVFSATVRGAQARRAQDGAEATMGSLIFDLAPAAAEKTTLVLSLAASDVKAKDGASAFTLAALQTVAAMTQTHALEGRDAAAQWRDAGGALVINGLNAEIEDAKIAVSGRIGLDRDNFPAGRLDAEIANPAGLAHMLGKAGALTPQEADAAAAGLVVMALGGGGKIAAPIELKSGAAHIGGVKIADLPKAP